MPTVDVRTVRGLLAEHQISHQDFARACQMGRSYISTILNGSKAPGELARFKMAMGLERLGLDREVAHAR